MAYTPEFISQVEEEYRKEIIRLTTDILALEDRYQRDVYGLNNEADPISGEPPIGFKRRAEKAEAELAALRAGQDALVAAAYEAAVRKCWAEASHRCG